MLKASAGPHCKADKPDVQLGLLADNQCHFYGHGNEETKMALNELNRHVEGPVLGDDVDLSNLYYSVSCDAKSPTISLWKDKCTEADMASEKPSNRVAQVPLQNYLDQCFNREHPIPSLHKVMSCNTHVRNFMESEHHHGVSTRNLHHQLAHHPFPVSFQASCAFPGQEQQFDQASSRLNHDSILMGRPAPEHNNGEDDAIWIAMPVEDFASMIVLFMAMFVMLVGVVMYKQKTHKLQATTVNVVVPNNSTLAPPAYSENGKTTKLNGQTYTEVKM